MKCNEFEEIGLDAERDTSLTEAQRAAVASHAASCPRCGALRDSWEATRLELRSLAQATGALNAPARVEMRLRQQFRTQYHTHKVRRAAVMAAWGLAAAAVLLGAVSWVRWHDNLRNHDNLQNSVAVKQNAPDSNQSSPDRNGAGDSQTLVADNEVSDFTLLPGVLPAETDGSAILSVRMQRGALSALGLPVNEDRASEWIQVDLLVGNDGLPQAVRLPESE